MIDIIITSYNEPNATLKAVQTFLKQKTKERFRVIVVDPFQEVARFLKSKIKDDRFIFFLDPGEGKSYALNLLFQEYGSSDKNDIFIMTDGDVYVSENTISEIASIFKDSKVGCLTGKPVSINSRENKYGYWSCLLFDGIDKVRSRLSREGKFFECSGYLFAIRKGIISDFPLETSEDSIIPYLFWKKGYKISYANKAEVYVKSPENWKDWTNQKVRNIKAHENLNNLAPDMPRTKSFMNEIKEGAIFALLYPRNSKEFFWTINLFIARLAIYKKAFSQLNKSYQDGWRGEATTNSTKTLD